ncbi:MAG TPA: hypothetical protein VEF07_01180 [Candidatus Binataceae bacterium]|nr:hypothetical protein [Candidatus Binataceae bacterium]
MIYVNIAGYIATALGGLVLGAMYGRRVAADAASLMHSIQTRLAAVEHAMRGTHDAGAQNAAATEHHASAIEKLAGAIEKHAAAVDDHGAATVAAAVESRSGGAAAAAKD